MLQTVERQVSSVEMADTLGLSAAQVDSFKTRGILRLSRHLPLSFCDSIVDQFWERAQKFDIQRNDRSTWDFVGNPSQKYRPLKNPLKRIRMEGFYDATLRRYAAYLLGEDLYTENPPLWLLTFPYQKDDYPDKSWETPRTFWHTDCPRLPCGGTPGIIALGYLDDVMPQGGGTMVVAGSHRLFTSRNQFLGSRQFKKKLNRYQFFKTLYSKSEDRPRDLRGFTDRIDDVAVEIVELTGETGDIVLLDGRILHSISENIHSRPRMMLRGFFSSRALNDYYMSPETGRVEA